MRTKWPTCWETPPPAYSVSCSYPVADEFVRYLDSLHRPGSRPPPSWLGPGGVSLSQISSVGRAGREATGWAHSGHHQLWRVVDCPTLALPLHGTVSNPERGVEVPTLALPLHGTVSNPERGVEVPTWVSQGDEKCLRAALWAAPRIKWGPVCRVGKTGVRLSRAGWVPCCRTPPPGSRRRRGCRQVVGR